MRDRPPDRRIQDVSRRRLAALADELTAARGGPTPARREPTGTPAEPATALREPEVERAEGRSAERAEGRSAEGPVEARTQPDTGRHARAPLPPARRVASWLADRVPGTLRGRAHLGSAQVGLVAVVVAAGLLLGAWTLVRSGSADAGEVVAPRVESPSEAAEATEPGTPGSPTSGSPGPVTEPGAPAAETAGDTEGEIVVDVVGKVRRPGIVVLPTGSRVADAVRAAGGLRGRVDRTTVNLARLLTDGEQVVVGAAVGAAAGGTVPGDPPAAPGTAPPAGALVNLNTAGQAELESLPGVGPVTAGAILEWRATHGAFTSVEELLEVSGIGEATLAEIAPHVTL